MSARRRRAALRSRLWVICNDYWVLLSEKAYRRLCQDEWEADGGGVDRSERLRVSEAELQAIGGVLEARPLCSACSMAEMEHEQPPIRKNCRRNKQRWKCAAGHWTTSLPVEEFAGFDLQSGNNAGGQGRGGKRRSKRQLEKAQLYGEDDDESESGSSEESWLNRLQRVDGDVSGREGKAPATKRQRVHSTSSTQSYGVTDVGLESGHVNMPWMAQEDSWTQLLGMGSHRLGVGGSGHDGAWMLDGLKPSPAESESSGAHSPMSNTGGQQGAQMGKQGGMGAQVEGMGSGKSGNDSMELQLLYQQQQMLAAQQQAWLMAMQQAQLQAQAQAHAQLIVQQQQEQAQQRQGGQQPAVASKLASLAQTLPTIHAGSTVMLQGATGAAANNRLATLAGLGVNGLLGNLPQVAAAASQEAQGAGHGNKGQDECTRSSMSGPGKPEPNEEEVVEDKDMLKAAHLLLESFCGTAKTNESK